MKRTLWLLLLLPAVLGAAWVWQKTRITQAEIEKTLWLLDYRIQLPVPETTPALQAMNAAFPVTVDGKNAGRFSSEDHPELMQALAAEGVSFPRAQVIHFEPVHFTDSADIEKLKTVFSPLAAYSQELYIAAPLPEQYAFIQLLKKAWPHGPDYKTGFSVDYHGDWRRMVKTAPWDSRLQLWETVNWNVEEPGPVALKPHRQTLVLYAGILPDGWLGEHWILTDFLKLNSRRLAVQLPLWSVAFIFLALPAPLFYFLRRPILSMLSVMWPILLKSAPAKT